jgi:acyl carrier protein
MQYATDGHFGQVQPTVSGVDNIIDVSALVRRGRVGAAKPYVFVASRPHTRAIRKFHSDVHPKGRDLYRITFTGEKSLETSLPVLRAQDVGCSAHIFLHGHVGRPTRFEYVGVDNAVGGGGLPTRDAKEAVEYRRFAFTSGPFFGLRDDGCLRLKQSLLSGRAQPSELADAVFPCFRRKFAAKPKAISHVLGENGYERSCFHSGVMATPSLSAFRIWLWSSKIEGQMPIFASAKAPTNTHTPLTCGRITKEQTVEREVVRNMMNEVLSQQQKQAATEDTIELRTLGFRSLDFSELALRVEDEIGDELNFDAAGLRAMHTVGDVLDFFETAAQT